MAIWKILAVQFKTAYIPNNTELADELLLAAALIRKGQLSGTVTYAADAMEGDAWPTWGVGVMDYDTSKRTLFFEGSQ